MKKISNNGFVLAETLVVTVFLMTIFTMLYSNFYPLIGEYEKRETYDDVNGKYSVYWLKRMIEDSSYVLSEEAKANFTSKGYARFECSNITDTDKQETCKNLVKYLEVEGCDKNGNFCEAYITKYRIGGESGVFFKDTVLEGKESGGSHTAYKKYEENCTKSSSACINDYVMKCRAGNNTISIESCQERAEKNLFRSGFKEYVLALPDYTTESLNYANYRVVASFQHKKDNNNYYSYATIEVDRK